MAVLIVKILSLFSMLNVVLGGSVLCGSASTYHDTQTSNKCAADSTQLQYKPIRKPGGGAWGVVVNSMTATINGVNVNTLGGFDLTKNILLSIKGTNNYGAVRTPKVDVEVLHCASGLFFGGCQWRDVSAINSYLKNIDPCDSSLGVGISDCHLSSGVGPTSIELNINLMHNPTIGGLINTFISHKTYYQLIITFREAAAGSAQTIVQVAADDFVL